MPAFYESFLWISQSFSFRNPDLHHGLLNVGRELITGHRHIHREIRHHHLGSRKFVCGGPHSQRIRDYAKRLEENTLTYNTQALRLGGSLTNCAGISITAASCNQFLLIEITSLVQMG
jgi:hypothetical protein